MPNCWGLSATPFKVEMATVSVMVSPETVTPIAPGLATIALLNRTLPNPSAAKGAGALAPTVLMPHT